MCSFTRRNQLSMAADPDASIALPFTPRPTNLNGELVGDVGFDPLNFSEEVRVRVCKVGFKPQVIGVVLLLIRIK